MTQPVLKTTCGMDRNTVWSGDVQYDGLSVNTRSSVPRKRDREYLPLVPLEGVENDWDFQTYFLITFWTTEHTSDEHPEDHSMDLEEAGLWRHGLAQL